MILWCTACSKEDREIAYANQETRIETFVTARRNANPDIRVEYNNGATRIVLTEGEGPELTGVRWSSITQASISLPAR